MSSTFLVLLKLIMRTLTFLWSVRMNTIDGIDEEKSSDESLIHSSHAKSLSAMDSRKSPWEGYVCGGIAAISNIIFVFPLHKTIFFQQLHGYRWTEAAHKLYSEGARYLYRGMLPPLLHKTTSLSVMFGVYTESKRFYPSLSINIEPAILHACSAVSAGLFECTLVPFERIQTLLQNSTYYNKYNNTHHVFTSIVRSYGFRELYRGLTPIAIRNCGGNVLYFVSREKMSQFSDPSRSPTKSITILSNFVTGALLGAFIGVITFPLNVAKTQMQTQMGGKFVSVYSAIYNVYVYRNRSMMLVYRGVPANCFRSMISWGVVTVTYELALNILFK